MFTYSDLQVPINIYGGADAADLPRYSCADIARATRVPAAAVRAWMRGLHHTRSAVSRPSHSAANTKPNDINRLLSFKNLLEINVLRALRQVHSSHLPSVREAIERALTDHQIDSLLIHADMCASGGTLFLNYYFEIAKLSNTQQLAVSKRLEVSLSRVSTYDSLHPQFFPIPRASASGDARPILISPYISFGDAVIARCGVTTAVISSRFDLGETRESIIEDYVLQEEEFDEAILYEAAA